MRREMRVHPVQWEALLDEKLAPGIPCEDEFAEYPVDGHHAQLPTNFQLASHFFEDFARQQLPLAAPPPGVFLVFIERPNCIRLCGNINSVPIHAAHVTQIA